MTVSGGQADLLAALLLGVALAVVAFLAFRASAKLALACWVITIGFVPVWFALPVVVAWMPGTVVGLIALAATHPWGATRLSLPDALVGAFFLACVVPIVIPGAWSRTSVVVALTQWGLAFLLGRVLLGSRLDPRWIYGLVTVVMAVVAALAILEFVLHWNPFVELGPPWSGSNRWRGLQERGGITRAEGAFGHSIALGSSLAMAVPLAIGSRIRPAVRYSVVVLLIVGSVVSFSRLGMIGAVLGLLLSLLAGPGISGRFRVSALAGTAVVAFVLLPAVLDVFEAASDESSRSAGYRADLLQLVPSMEFFGFSRDASLNASGELTFLQFESIDSALILLGLTYGWFALGIAIALLVLAVREVLVRRAEPPTISIVAQIPALMTVALITQYAMFFWFIAGLAVASQVVEHRRPEFEGARIPVMSFPEPGGRPGPSPQ